MTFCCLSGLDVACFIMASFFLMTTLFDIKKQIQRTAIFPAMKYLEFRDYESFSDHGKVNIASRTTNK